MTFHQILVERKERICPDCHSILEWCCGKTDNTEQEYECKRCRVFIRIMGMTQEDQEIIAEMAFD